MAFRLYLIRHGETDWNAEGRIQGATDVALNARGRAQARALAEHLREVPLGGVCSSPLRRCLETAREVASPHGLAVQEDRRLQELDQGELEGRTFEELHRTHPEFMALWGTSPAELQMPGGESLVELQRRAWAAVERLPELWPERTAAAVSHNLAIITIVCRVLGVELNRFRALRQNSAALNLLEWAPGRGWSVLLMNSTFHLRGLDGSGAEPYDRP